MNNEIQEIRYQVGEAWKGTYNAATTYGNANVVQDPTGLSVYRSLKPGNVGHPLTDTAWWFLIIDLSSIKEESDRIKALNDAIAADEAQRVENENGRVTAEQGRVDAETARVTAEQGRVAAEQQRVSAEQQRASQEQTRISQEQSRVTAEQGRVAAEAQRVQKEQLRENNEAQRVINETNRVAAEAERVAQYAADHQQAVADHDQYVDSLGAFDISAYHATGGVLATYADLAAALGTNGANVPASIRRGGMSVKFVQSSDNKYVQYRLTADEWSIDTDDWAIYSESVYVDNPEFIYVKTDAEGKILWAIKIDGDIYYGAGCPQQVKDYIEKKIAELSLDEYEDIVAFLDNLEKGDKTLQTLLNEKVDKEEGKGLSTNDYTNVDKELVSTHEIISNTEYISVETDSDEKVLSGRKTDGSKVENLDVTLKKNATINGSVNIGGGVSISKTLDLNGTKINQIEKTDDIIEAKADKEGKVLSYRDGNGVLHEVVGIEAESIQANTIDLSSKGVSSLKNSINSCDKIKKYDLPKNGTINIVSETFYLTYNEGYSNLNNVYPIQVYENTVANAKLKRVCQVYYVKSSLQDNGDGTYSLYNDGVEGHDINLGFYASGEVTEVSGNYYVTETLEDGQPTVDSIRVTQLTGVPNVQAWAVNKNTEHNCVVDIDFGDYLNGRFYIKVKFQGNSTMEWPKRNLRFTFYKNNKYEKKLKVKIGEFVRLSGFNVKAFYADQTRMHDLVLSKMFMAIYENRPMAVDAYPWNESEGYYTGATGFIKEFPVRVSLGGEFYGLDMFGLKKDEKNYLLDGDDDDSGIFVTAETNDYTYNGIEWKDEMGAKGRELAYPSLGDDSVSVTTDNALAQLFDFIQGKLYADTNNNTYAFRDLTDMDGVYYVTSTLTDNGDGTYSINENSIAASKLIKFNKENAKERLFILGWLDYLIGLEVFYLIDNRIHNIILYSGRDKKKFCPFFYDLDFGVDMSSKIDVFKFEHENDSISDNPLWGPIFNTFKDEIYNRFKFLAGTILNKTYMTELLDDAYKDIPEEWWNEEQSKWGNIGNTFYENVNYIDDRVNWLSNNVFNVQI